MLNIPYLIYLFFQKRKLIFIFLIVLLCGLVGYYASQIKLEEDITRFVPSDKNTASVNAILDNLKSKDKLIIHFSVSDPENIDLMTECADSVYHGLISGLKKDEDYLNLMYQLSDDRMQQVYDIFYRNLPLFLQDQDYEHLTGKLNSDSIRETLQKDYQSLLSPSGVVLGKYIMQDPLSITPLALKKLQSIQLDENFETYNGCIVTKDHQHLLMFITPAHAPNETKQNTHLISTVKQLSGSMSAVFPEIKIEPFGACMVSSGNADQLRKDTVLTSSIAVILIALLLILYFRNPLLIIFILFPVAFGMLFSLSILFITKGVVSAIAIGAGAVVLGIAINYSLHFFTHYKHVKNVKEVLGDLTLPMLIGCTTTVGAFFSLLFAKSEALHDFGQFAGFSLIGAMLFSIIVLPHLLKFVFRKDQKESIQEEADHQHHTFLDKLTAIHLDKQKSVVIGSFILTLVFAWFSRYVNFESDMNKMSFMTDELRQAEKHLDEVNHFAARSVYIFTSGQDINEALEHNQQVEKKLLELKEKGIIKKYSSVSAIYSSEQEQERRITRWNNYLTEEKKQQLKHDLMTSGAELKFKEQAFQRFYELLDKPFKPLSIADRDTLKELILKEWVGQVNGKPSIINHIKVDASNREKIYEAFAAQDHVVVFDKQNLTSRFVSMISQDFNTILLITSLLVFGFMLISHGRIELAIINFLPMFVSWLWILGIMGLFGIKFNIINIIISTFIFGLGDDYSIFIMDGLLNEYKFGKKNLDSFKSSILLSALITIIGIGVMVFAKHPALQSIALITIIGMICVVLISFIVQPLLFNWMVLNRRYKGLQPYSAKYIFITVIGFTGFVIGALFLTICGLIIFTIFPAGKKKRKLIFHYLIVFTFRTVLASFFNVKKTIINEHHEDFSKPAIIIANHQSHIDLALTLQLHPKMIVFTNNWVYHSPFYGWIVKMADYYPASEGYEKSLTKLEHLVKDGYSILIFPEGTRSVDGEIHRFHKGAFLLAEKLNLDILPLLIHGAGDTVTKGDFHFKDGALTVKILKRIAADDLSFGTTYQDKTKSISKYMRAEYEALREQCETVDYFRSRLIRNYIFKGPVLEWYCRIKTKLENNYQLFESLMPKKGIIVDVGCGYGFLPYMLMYKGKNRQVLGVDYDDEKIAVADNCVHKTPNMSFAVGDVTTYNFPSADGFIISDVLHYLEKEQQVRVIEHCVEKLNKGGVLVIRDADADLTARQKGTWYTEFFSTNSGFNKTSGKGLHFVSGQLIKDALAKYDFLSVEVIDNTKLTSNIIYVARYL